VNRAVEAIKERHFLWQTSDNLELACKLLPCIATILSFTASSFTMKETQLSFTAGLVGTIGVTVSGWSYSFNMECTERQERLNVIVTEAGLRAEWEPDPVDEPSEKAKRSSSVYWIT
jgi:hypothetical protein